MFLAPKAPLAPDLLAGRCKQVREQLVHEGIYRAESEDGNTSWRVGTEPYWIRREEAVFLQNLGGHLLSFYRSLNRLYFESLKGRAPAWVAAYLDAGKPDGVLHFGRMNRFKQDLPGVIRPDLLLTPTGMVATELDAVPGGVGLTAALSRAYTDVGFSVVGGAAGMVEGFARMIRFQSAEPQPHLAIVISEESKDYRAEMSSLAKALDRSHFPSQVLTPSQIGFTEEGLFFEAGQRRESIDVLYRFFELFDLINIPKVELIFYAAKKKLVVLTPPPKPQLEEKLAFALFHHPVLRPYWRESLGEGTDQLLTGLFPSSWVLDPRTVPPHATIPGLTVASRPVQAFDELSRLSQKERHLVIKPSGFSELAWGSRGVSVGHDLSEGDWRAVIDRALESFNKTPHILQHFCKGRQDRVSYYDFDTAQVRQLDGRTRLSPYYFVEGDRAILGGALATICSLEKKLIHGMVDAVMVPCALESNGPAAESLSAGPAARV